MQCKISCIIPAYNEEKRIANILKVVVNHPLIEEIVVVNDGSVDNTEKIVKNFNGIRLINNQKNLGKTPSLIKGIKSAQNDIVFLLDSDLMNVTEKNISDLINPIVMGRADVTLSMRKNPIIFRIIGVDFVTGERVFYKNLFNFDEFEYLPCFGFESFMNKKIIKKKYRIKVVKWNNVFSPLKSSKIGFVKGFLWHISMWKEMTKVMGLLGWISQSYKLLKLKV